MNDFKAISHDMGFAKLLFNSQALITWHDGPPYDMIWLCINLRLNELQTEFPHTHAPFTHFQTRAVNPGSFCAPTQTSCVRSSPFRRSSSDRMKSCVAPLKLCIRSPPALRIKLEWEFACGQLKGIVVTMRLTHLSCLVEGFTACDVKLVAISGKCGQNRVRVESRWCTSFGREF